MRLNRIMLSSAGMCFSAATVFGIPYPCSECKFVSTDPQRTLVHTAIEHKQYRCLECQQGYNEQNPYVEHLKTEHGLYVCLKCNFRVFKTEADGRRHNEKYHLNPKFLPDVSFSYDDGANDFACRYCRQMLGKSVIRGISEQQVHYCHRHGTLKQFLFSVRPLHDCCKPFFKEVIEHIGEETWDYVKALSEHVYEAHDRCLLCEREPLSSYTNWFGRESANPDLAFKYPRKRMYLSQDGNFRISCFCGRLVLRNEKSKLFQLRIGVLPFGRGTNVTTYPYACVIDGSKDELSSFLSEKSEVTSKNTPDDDPKATPPSPAKTTDTSPNASGKKSEVEKEDQKPLSGTGTDGNKTVAEGK